MRHRLPFVVAVITLSTLAACSSDEKTESSAQTTDSVAPGPQADTSDASFNDADVEFAQSMIPHHEQAVEMAEIALDPTVGAGAPVTDLATRIQGAQDPEIELMTGWLEAWGEPVAMDTSDGHDMSAMDGMMSAADMDELRSLTGGEFDTRWLEMMVEHHRGAITMADDVLADGADPEVLQLATDIVAAQQSEIDEMNAILSD
jgi:uncharacterized protein (DUF305 family)